MTATISLILAASENGVIGRDGGLPWRLRDDLAHFMRTTKGHPVIMGRKTFESAEMGSRPLPHRPNIVVTSRPDFDAPDVLVAHGLDEALALAGDRDDDEVFVIGGASLYAAAFERAGRLYLTRVHALVDGDTFCPPFDLAGWTLVRDERHDADARNEHAFSVRVYERV